MDERLLMAKIGNNPGWVAYILCTFLGLILTYFTQDWKWLFVIAIIAGLFAGTYTKGVKYGSLSVMSVYLIQLFYLLVTSPSLNVLNIFVSVIDENIGPIGLAGMGWIALLVIMLIGFLVGTTGGYFGSVWHSLINWDEWVWW
jgi:hypothetical protein